MILKLCAKCGAPTLNRPAICDECAAKHPQEKLESARYYDANLRDVKTDAFYHSADWKRSRLAYLQSIGWFCEDCVEEARQGLRSWSDVRVATDVHHVKPLRTHWELRLTWSNFRGLCDGHHKQKRSKSCSGGVSKKTRHLTA